MERDNTSQWSISGEVMSEFRRQDIAIVNNVSLNFLNWDLLLMFNLTLNK